MKRQSKDIPFSCKFTKETKAKLEIISKKTGFSQSQLIAELIDSEYEKIKSQSWEQVFVQMSMFDTPDPEKTLNLFDQHEEKNDSSNIKSA